MGRQSHCRQQPRLSPPRVGRGFFLTYFPTCRRTGCARPSGGAGTGRRESPGRSRQCGKRGDAPGGYRVWGSASPTPNPTPRVQPQNRVPTTTCTPPPWAMSLCKPSQIMLLHHESLGRRSPEGSWRSPCCRPPLPAETIPRFICGSVHFPAHFPEDYIIALDPYPSACQRKRSAPLTPTRAAAA